MDKITGLTADTRNRLLYDAGIVYANYGLGGQKILGATRGGNTCTIEQEIRQMPVDGQPGDVKGDRRRTRVTVKLAVNLIEMSTDSVTTALQGATITPNATHDVITRTAQITDGDYFDNITLILQKAGTAQRFGFKVKNALVTSNFSIGAADNDEPVNAVEFTGNFLVSNLVTEPWEIFNPLEGASGYYTLTYIAGANGAIIGNTSQIIQDGLDGAPVYAAADALYAFDDWDVANTSANPRKDLAVGADITATATFKLIV